MMSFWLRRRDKQGRVYWYSVSVPYLVVIAVLGIILALVLPILQWLWGLLY
jgi:hypothetical protein